MIFNMSGGGGAGLNFKVVGGPSQRTKPESPSKNMIWVDTDTDISSWVISIAQPTNPEPGMIWISTGKFNNYLFNALKKNSIQINPNGIYQYVDEAWAEVYAEIHNGEGWSPMKFDLWLIKDAVYNAEDFGAHSGSGYTLPAIYGTGLTLPYGSAFNTGSITATEKKLIDFSKYSSIEFEINYHNYGNVEFKFMNASGVSVIGSIRPTIPTIPGNTYPYKEVMTLTIDLSQYSASLKNNPCYVSISGAGNNSSNMNTINNIRFIPA